MNEILIPLLIKHEGLRLTAYRCPAGKLTIGVGHNILENRSSATALSLELREGSVITKEQAMQILKEDVARCLFEFRQFDWFYHLSTTRQCALVDMLFNLGLPRFLKFKKFIAAMEAEDYGTASMEMLSSAWATQVGDRAHTLAFMVECDSLVS